MRRFAPFALALLLDLVGAGGVLLVSVQHWQTITTPRPAPLRDDVLHVTGRTIDSAPTALALVALAGVVAVLATRGLARRAVGGIVALAGIGLVWRALAAAAAVSVERARRLVTDHHATVDASHALLQIRTNTIWPTATVVGGLLVLASGVLIAWRGHRWQVMSARYAAPADRHQQRAQAATALWSALDRGDDPTR